MVDARSSRLLQPTQSAHGEQRRFQPRTHLRPCALCGRREARPVNERWPCGARSAPGHHQPILSQRLAGPPRRAHPLGVHACAQTPYLPHARPCLRPVCASTAVGVLSRTTASRRHTAVAAVAPSSLHISAGRSAHVHMPAQRWVSRNSQAAAHVLVQGTPFRRAAVQQRTLTGQSGASWSGAGSGARDRRAACWVRGRPTPPREPEPEVTAPGAAGPSSCPTVRTWSAPGRPADWRAAGRRARRWRQGPGLPPRTGDPLCSASAGLPSAAREWRQCAAPRWARRPRRR